MELMWILLNERTKFTYDEAFKSKMHRKIILDSLLLPNEIRIFLNCTTYFSNDNDKYIKNSFHTRKMNPKP